MATECTVPAQEIRSCNVTNGTGLETRNCGANGRWNDWTCAIAGCNDGYTISGDKCDLIPPVVTECTVPAQEMRFCAVPNGTGLETRNCEASGAWSTWACVVTSCENGYPIVGNSCDTSKTRLVWNANPSSEYVRGYKIYFGTNSGLYDGSCTTNVSVTSPIDVPVTALSNASTPNYIVADLKSGMCYFAITAYNQIGETAKTGEMLISRP